MDVFPFDTRSLGRFVQATRSIEEGSARIKERLGRRTKSISDLERKGEYYVDLYYFGPLQQGGLRMYEHAIVFKLTPLAPERRGSLRAARASHPFHLLHSLTDSNYITRSLLRMNCAENIVV